MSKGDLFGLEREKLIASAGVREVFTPHKPISSIELFFGRKRQVQKLVEHVNTPGQHALLYGDRGVGKSSLANIASQLLLSQLIEGELYTKRCDSSDSFESIVASPLSAASGEQRPKETKKVLREGGSAGIKAVVAEAGVRTERETSETFEHKPHACTPSVVAERLEKFPGLLLVDEADAIPSETHRKRLAELIKLLSDCQSPFKLLVVGVAETGEELTSGHPSVGRCLKETKLGRMSPDELHAIIVGGAGKLSITFTEDAIASIVKLSSGYPHFTHLLGLKCAEEAIATKLKLINKQDVQNALKHAVSDAEGSLKRVYDTAVRSYSTDMYKTILIAASRIDDREFSAEQLRDAYQLTTSEQILQVSLNNYLTKLVSEGEGTVLRRIAKGIYRFNDPRMPSYIRIANDLLM